MNQKITAVFLHGFGENASVWQNILPALATDFSILIPDFSLKSDYQNLEELTTWLKQLLDNQGVTKVCLIGHSMGGYLALAFAERFPEMIVGLGLFHSTSYADSDERKAIRLKTMDFIAKHGSAEFIKDFFPNMFSEAFRQKNKAFIQQKISEYSNIPKEALIAATKAMRERLDRREILEKSNFPIFFIAGKLDKFVPVEQSLEQILLLKNPFSLVLDDAAHAGMYEAPEVCTEKIKDFLAKIAENFR